MAIAAGGCHSLALTDGDRVVGWGTDGSGQAGLSNVMAIAAGGSHSLALIGGGSVAGWGIYYGFEGEPLPVVIPTELSNVVSVAAGGSHSLALTAEGRLTGWGWNFSGQISIPVGLSNVVAIAAGDRHSLALTAEGAVVGWGNNWYGQASPPVGLSNVVAIAAGGWHSLALTAEGTVIGWGDNSSGQARPPAGLSNVVAIAAGWGHSLALQGDRTPPCFIKQPLERSACLGDQVWFQVGAMGFPLLRYQWLKDGLPLLGATSAMFALTVGTTNDAGNYAVVVWNGLGSVGSWPAALQVRPEGAPSIRINGRLAVGTVFANRSATATLSGGFPNGLIFYTLDGSEPHLGSGFYTGPFALSNNAIIRAMSLSGDLSQSAVAPAVTVLVVPSCLTTSVMGSGTISVSPAWSAYPSNSVATLTAKAGLGFAFDHWKGDLTGSTNPALLSMNGPKGVEAVFVRSAYPLTLSSGEGGSATADGQSIGPSTWYAVGTVVRLEAAPEPGWGFLRWEGTVSSTNNPLDLVMDRTNEVRAVFGTTLLTVGTPGGGAVTADGQSIGPETHYPPGAVVVLAAVPEPGWSFLRWEGTVSGTDNPLLLTMDRDHSLQAIFGTEVRTAVAGGGAILVEPANPVPYGATVTVRAVPAPDWTFLAWSGAVRGSANPTSFTVTNAQPLVGAVFTGPPVPVILVEPTNQTVLVGHSALFSVSAGGSPPLSYQWRKAGEPLAGATNAGLVLPAVGPADAGAYDVVVANAYGAVTSAVAVLTVVVPPALVAGPQDQVVAAGSRVSLSVEASGTEPLSYQWLDAAGPVAGATSSTLVFDPVQLEQGGSYWVVVANPWGAVTSAVATVTVYVPVSLLAGPETVVVSWGGTAELAVQAAGYPAPQFQWWFEGQALAGATNSTLVLTNVGTNLLGRYQVAVWNPYSALTSAPTWLVMAPSLRTPFAGATVLWGRAATLSVGAVGSGPLSYQWYKDGAPLAGATNATLALAAAQPEDAGLYGVVVSNPWGSVTNAPAQLVVNPANISLGLYAGVTLEGTPGYRYEIQYTTDLRDTNAWVVATNLVLEASVELWVDTSVDLHAPGAKQRYYRVVGR